MVDSQQLMQPGRALSGCINVCVLDTNGLLPLFGLCSSGIQKKLYNILIDKIPNGWNSLISRRLSDFGVESDLMHNSFEFFRVKLKRIQPHLRMSFIKTLTNGWHTSSRMHEATCLPCIFGCQALPSSCMAPINNDASTKVIRDETAHYLNCPILSGLIMQATGLDHLLSLHELIFGNGIDDLTGVLACATSYHVYHSLKLGNLPIIQKAIETGTFSQVRAYGFSCAKAFLNDFDILSTGGILSIGSQGLQGDRIFSSLSTNESRPLISNSHLDDNCPDILAQGPDS